MSNRVITQYTKEIQVPMKGNPYCQRADIDEIFVALLFCQPNLYLNLLNSQTT